MNRFRNHRCRRGVAIVWVAITMLVLLGLVGLALDTARVLLVAHELQNAADAGALAGAEWVRSDPDQAMSAARTIAAANTAEGIAVAVADNPTNDAAGKVVIGRFDRDTQTFTATLTAPNAVKVIAGRTAGQNGSLPLIFGPIFNVSTSDVQRQSIAMVGGGTGAGLIALSPTGPGFSYNGTVNLTVDQGAIQIDASSSPISGAGASGRIIATDGINVVASSATIGPPNYTGDLNTNSDYVPDPLASLPAPPSTNPQTAVNNKGNNSITINPGYYAGGITQQNGSMTMNPGVYVVDNGFSINGGNLTAHGVMIYVKTGPLTLLGNGNISITPIDDTDPNFGTDAAYEGVSLFQARTNTTLSTISGTNNTTSIGGTLYFPNNTINLQGTGDLTAGNQLIANKVSIGGTGTITIHYDGRNPAAGNKVFLVQ
jgi:Flp pilus assembly protein TadG